MCLNSLHLFPLWASLRLLVDGSSKLVVVQLSASWSHSLILSGLLCSSTQFDFLVKIKERCTVLGGEVITSWVEELLTMFPLLLSLKSCKTRISSIYLVVPGILFVYLVCSL